MRGRRTLPPLRIVLTLLVTPLLLTSCLSRIFETCSDPLTVDLSSPRILDGVWTGTIRDHWVEGKGEEVDVLVDLVAMYRDEESYDVAGTFTVGNEPARSLTGTVSGACYERYRASAAAALSPSMQPPPPTRLDAEARDDDGTVWQVRAEWAGLVDADERPFEIWRIDPDERWTYVGSGILTRDGRE